MKAIIGLFAILFLAVLGVVGSLHGQNFSLGSKAKTVTIDQHVFTVDVVSTDKDREKGLSGRGNLAIDHGMLFVYQKPAVQIFWMKDMHFPLDIIFINSGKIITISSNVPAPKANTPDSSLPVYTSTGSVDHVLELNAGTTKKDNLHVGDTVIYSL